MADNKGTWGDIVWDSASSEYRQSQFTQLIRSIIHHGEIDDCCEALVQASREDAEELCESLETAISDADATGDSDEDDGEEG